MSQVPVTVDAVSGGVSLQLLLSGETRLLSEIEGNLPDLLVIMRVLSVVFELCRRKQMLNCHGYVHLHSRFQTHVKVDDPGEFVYFVVAGGRAQRRRDFLKRCLNLLQTKVQK